MIGLRETLNARIIIVIKAHEDREELKRAVWRVMIDNEMLITEKLIIDLNEDLTDAGIQLIFEN